MMSRRDVSSPPTAPTVLSRLKLDPGFNGLSIMAPVDLGERLRKDHGRHLRCVGPLPCLPTTAVGDWSICWIDRPLQRRKRPAKPRSTRRLNRSGHPECLARVSARTSAAVALGLQFDVIAQRHVFCVDEIPLHLADGQWCRKLAKPLDDRVDVGTED